MSAQGDDFGGDIGTRALTHLFGLPILHILTRKILQRLFQGVVEGTLPDGLHQEVHMLRLVDGRTVFNIASCVDDLGFRSGGEQVAHR